MRLVNTKIKNDLIKPSSLMLVWFSQY